MFTFGATFRTLSAFHIRQELPRYTKEPVTSFWGMQCHFRCPIGARVAGEGCCDGDSSQQLRSLLQESATRVQMSQVRPCNLCSLQGDVPKVCKPVCMRVAYVHWIAHHRITVPHHVLAQPSRLIILLMIVFMVIHAGASSLSPTTDMFKRYLWQHNPAVESV